MKLSKDIEKFVNNFLKKKEKSKFIPGTTPIAASAKLIGDYEIKNMIGASLEGWLTTGRYNDEFEKKIIKFFKS